jgi:hypothetical protein
VGAIITDSGTVFWTKAGISIGTDVAVEVDEGIKVGVDVDVKVGEDVLVWAGVGESADVGGEVGRIPCRNSEGLLVGDGQAKRFVG